MLDARFSEINCRSATGLLTLSAIKGVGRVAIDRLVSRFPTFGDMLDADDDDLKGIINATQRQSLRDERIFGAAFRKALNEQSRAAELDVVIVSRHDPDYPERLSALDEPPPLLYVAGSLKAFDRSLAFVGTREPTPFGNVVAERMAQAASRDGWTVVSGLARGIESTCHRAAMEAGGTTCAVLASGLDVYASEAAMALAKRIFEEGGTLISEQPFGTEANRGSHIGRDRLVAALSLATFFVQGESHAGAMQSVRYALAQGRPVYVPGVPEGYRGEPLNEAAIDLAGLTVAQAASKFEWNGSVMSAVEARPNALSASAVGGRDDYARVFSEIRETMADLEASPRSVAMR